jgi:hypothetical protein
MDLFALATVTTRPDEAGGPPPTKIYELRDNLRRAAGLAVIGALVFDYEANAPATD